MAKNPRKNPPHYHSPLVTHKRAATSPPIPAKSPQHRTFTPHTFSPPSPHHHHPLSLSPPPSSFSPTPSPCPFLSPTSMVEIEELSDDDIDSGIELLHGEFEDAPDESQQEEEEDSDSEDKDEGEEKHTVLRGLQRPWAQQLHPSRKREYTESLDGGSEGDESGGENANTDSNSGGWIRWRRLAPLRKCAEDVSSRMSTPEFMMEMEL